MLGGDLRSGTVPVSGLQYSSSPSIPTAVKAVNSVRDVQAVRSTLPATAAGSLKPLPQSTLEMYDKYYASLPATELAASRNSRHNNHDTTTISSGGSPQQGNWSASLTLPDALSSIGPSARRLLQLDEVQRKDAEQRRKHAAGQSTATAADGDNMKAPEATRHARLSSYSGSKGHPHSNTWQASLNTQQATTVSRTPVVPAAARTLPVHAGKLKTSSGRQRGQGGAASTARKASRVSDAQIDVRPPLLSSTITQGSACGTDAAAPPLVAQLQSYIQRELLRSVTGGVAAPSAMEQLGPYRESFRALGSAFPAYAALLSDIQSAYDNVIQAQAELLTDAYASMTVREVERSSNQELVATLHDQVNNLQEELKSMEDALESRALAEAQERRPSSGQRPRSAQLADAVELRRELDSAHQRIGDLERNSQGDLEKIVILIGAVRECDRRLKEYERIVASVTGQVSELDEFKRIAGEAQAELQLFRKKYADYVPVTDFQLMKEYLAAELEAAQLLTRRWRRTAAVRGTQLDIMQRRLAALEEDRAALTKAADGAEGDTAAAAAATRGLLTPRPSWKKFYAELPELAEYAADAGQLTTASDRTDDAAPPTADSGDGAGTATASSRLRPVPVVKGLKETSLQVEYLVQRVRALEKQTAEQLQLIQQHQQQQYVARYSSVQFSDQAEASARGGSVISNVSVTAADIATAADKDRNTSSSTSKPAAAATSKAAETSSQRRASRRPQHRHSEALQASPTSVYGAAVSGGAGAVPPLAPPLELPLVGLGYGPEVPVYLRASGVVPRRPVPPSTIVSLVYHFFLDVLPSYLDQHDQPQRGSGGGGDDAEGGMHERDRLGRCLCEYLESEMATREDLKHYASVSHLMMNLVRDGEAREWFSDALHVLLWTMSGVLPPRIAVDAAVVVAQVKRDVRALSKEMQTSRLRRQAVSECLQPVLELKSTAEVAELRAALGGETTFSVDTLCSEGHPFMQVLLVQECRSSAELYVSFLTALSARAASMASRAGSANAKPTIATAASSTSANLTANKSTASPASPQHTQQQQQQQPKLEEGDRVITLADVAAAIQEVEPQTPGIVVRELSLNAVAASGKQELFGAPSSPLTAARTTLADGDGTSKAHSAEEGCIVVRLSDIVRAIGAAPLIRRTLQNTPENCVL